MTYELLLNDKIFINETAIIYMKSNI